MANRIPLRDDGRKILVAREDGIPFLVSEFEYRMDLLRYAETLRPGCPEQAFVTDRALNGEFPACPPEIAAQFADGAVA